MAAGTKEMLYLLVLITGTLKQRPKGNSSNSVRKGLILALQKRSSLPKHLIVVKVCKLGLTPPWNLTSHFDEATEAVLVGQSQVPIPSNNAEH